MPHSLELIASTLFFLAVVHTFCVNWFQHLALRFPEGSIPENLFHLLGEVEVVFGLWATLLIAIIAFQLGGAEAVHYVESLNFNEPIFVFVVMTIAATKPIVNCAEWVIELFSRLLPLGRRSSAYLSTLVIGPLLGSLITEPAAMTVSALVLKKKFFSERTPLTFRYLTLAVLFVNVSIGGVLTHFAAPPVLMVASKWNWDTAFMFSTFGWKAILGVSTNALISTFVSRRVLRELEESRREQNSFTPASPVWLIAIHLIVLGLVVLTAHHPIVFIGAFLLFLGVTTITGEYQEELKLKESLLVSYFLGGLVVLGGLQRWWLEPILTSLGAPSLFAGATLLTAFTDNAALTYLGSQVPNLSDALKYALVAGAVAGGGLSVIANAPNPAGFAILRSSFGEEGISPWRLFAAAILPTMVAMVCLWWL